MRRGVCLKPGTLPLKNARKEDNPKVLNPDLSDIPKKPTKFHGRVYDPPSEKTIKLLENLQKAKQQNNTST